MSEQERIPWWQKLCAWLWKIAGFLGATVLVGLGVNLLSTWLTTAPGGIPADAPLSQIMAQWLLLLIAGICLLLLALLFYIVSRWPGRAPTSSTLTWRDREILLQRLHCAYDEMMSYSIQGAVWLELGLAGQPGAVQNVTTLLLRLSDRAGRQFPAGTTLLQIYDKAAHELLILGEPGAGKSTLLTSLAKELVARAQADETHPLPVIFPLSSWATKRLPLKDWLIEQLASPLYNVSRKLSTSLVREGLILPLLDGLDEVQESARPACIEAINTYHHEHLSALVVCSRTTEYRTATTQRLLALQGAVVVQPLTREQVNIALTQMRKDVAALRSALKKNASLQELATTPLMLNVLILTYRGTSLRQLPEKHAALQQQVWTDYVARMVERKGETVKSKADAKPHPRYSLEQIRAWLGWLAYQMREHNQTVFYLEQLQPDWLPERWRFHYRWSVVL
ncbi:MAG: NACHT domain-containing protein, partial [Ktedonobacteraceae bacterium]|nr:NACHT domain-containing protein [Ktedonobacteraceae bacterium]